MGASLDPQAPGLACVVNVSEGRDRATVAALAEAGGRSVLDVHSDPDHHRSVLTMGGPKVEDDVRAVARRAVERLDLRRHHGVHPRLGVLDVVPFTPLDAGGVPASGAGDLGPAVAARDRFAAWAGTTLALPCFVYGPERSLPDVRRRAFADLAPDTGPDRPHPSAGACAVGARPALVAYNLWLDAAELTVARAIAGELRGPRLRALGLSTAGVTQVSCNLLDPFTVGPASVYDAVAQRARRYGTRVVRAELVGLAPAAVVAATPSERFEELDLDPMRTFEARLALVALAAGPGATAAVRPTPSPKPGGS